MTCKTCVHRDTEDCPLYYASAGNMMFFTRYAKEDDFSCKKFESYSILGKLVEQIKKHQYISDSPAGYSTNVVMINDIYKILKDIKRGKL